MAIQLPYGRTWYDGGHIYAHRLAYMLAVGPVDGWQVLHTCDNPKCCNPAHLELGTHAENMRQMRERGRASRIGHPFAKGDENPARKAQARRLALAAA